ncbi:MAG: GGDEF domain-containing protein [Acidobacteriaceae bacterium]
MINYGTFFFTNIVSVTVFTACLCLLAWRNRAMTGLRWFAGGMAVGLVKLVLQGLDDKIPATLSEMVAQELYLVSFVMQFLGLRWFVQRKPLHSRWPFVVIGLALVVYTILFLNRVPYSSNVINIPNILVCGVAAWILFKNGRGPFAAVARVTALILVADAVVMTIRAILTDLYYKQADQTERALTDWKWVYSLAAMAFLATCMVMCMLWFLVTELSKELAEQARTDPLTGAMNRRAMEDTALRETTRSIRYGHLPCMIVLDIDDFKHINDTLGHAAGDAVLQALVHQIKPMMRVNDVLARTGGEEFTILLPNTTASAGIVAAERVRQSVEALEVPFEDEIVRFTISAGVAQLDPAQGGWEGMMRRADAAMYEAKECGRNTVRPKAVSYNPESAKAPAASIL